MYGRSQSTTLRTKLGLLRRLHTTTFGCGNCKGIDDQVSRVRGINSLDIKLVPVLNVSSLIYRSSR